MVEIDTVANQNGVRSLHAACCEELIRRRHDDVRPLDGFVFGRPNPLGVESLELRVVVDAVVNEALLVERSLEVGNVRRKRPHLQRFFSIRIDRANRTPNLCDQHPLIKLLHQRARRAGNHEWGYLNHGRRDATDALGDSSNGRPRRSKICPADVRSARTVVVDPHNVVALGENPHDLVLARGIVVPTARDTDNQSALNHG